MSSTTANAVLQKFREHRLAHFRLDGRRGLEIGAASHNPFGLNTRNVAPQDDFDHYAQETHRLFGLEPAPVDIWAYAWDIPVPDQSEDFIISSHVIEHLPDVITTFIEWNRVTRNSGQIFMIVPVKGALPEDEPRELTPLQHFIQDYDQKLNLETHPTEGVPGGRMGHYHTFTPESLIAVVDYMRVARLCDWKLVARENVDTKVGNGFTLVFEVAHEQSILNLAELDAEPVAQAPESLRSLNNKNGDRDASEILAQYGALQQEHDALRTTADGLSAKLDFSTVELARYEKDVVEFRTKISEYELAIAEILNSETYSIGAALWRMRAALAPLGSFRERVLKTLLSLRKKSRAFDPYSAWITQNEPSAAELKEQGAAALKFPYRPLISILTPVHNTPPELLRAAIESVLSQTYDHWELCIAIGKSDSDKLHGLLQDYAQRDKRIRIKLLENNLGISGNSNECLGMAEGEFIALLDHDDLLARPALFEVARLLNTDRTIDFIYSDRDLITEHGERRYDPFFKPDWSPEIMLCANYVTHFNVARKDLAVAIGGFDPSADGAQDWDFFLRLTERTSRVAH
ncbi:MAG TPA: glycosyltransferase, partial [Pyrinomonadaceae bacterium]|nr:glycosyltransferase [Pyrinomonadaceae bacterium]